MIVNFFSNGIGLKVEAGQELLGMLQNLDFLYQYVPSFEIREDNKDGAILKIIEASAFEFFFDGSQYVLHSDSRRESLKDIVTIIDYVFERERQLRGVYCLHGCASSLGSRGVWLMGPVSGMGKTTLNLTLCENNGYSFIGDEKILLDSKGQITGGVKNISYNKDVLKLSLSSNFDNLTVDELVRKIPVEMKSVPLSLVVLPVLINGCEILEEDRWGKQKAAFHLYEELSRKIRGVSRRVNGFSVPLQSIDDDQIALKRSTFANILGQSIPFYLIKGGRDQVAARVVELSEQLL